MAAVMTLVTEIEQYLRDKALTLTQFAESTGLHSGTLSNILHGRRPISIQQLDRITAALEQSPGFFYNLYIQDYMISGASDWRRIGPLLQRCAELDRLGTINHLLGHIMDNLMYLPMLFDTAESILNQGYSQAAALLYEAVAESEKLQHSERLALCRYRLFAIRLSENQDENLRAANQFEPYVERLDEAVQLDAMKHLADIYASLHNWDKVLELAKLMGDKATWLYHHELKTSSFTLPARPTIYYILYAHLLGSLVYDELGDYDMALVYTSLYAEVSWVKAPASKEERQVIEQFTEWSIANTYLYRLMSGEIGVLAEYVEYVETREDEIFQALFKIVQAANRHHFDVDHVLTKFKQHLSYKEQSSRLGKFTKQLTGDKYTRFLTELAKYHLKKGNADAGFEYLIASLESSIETRNSDNTIRCVGLFEKYRALASIQHEARYKERIDAIYEIHEEKAHYSIGNQQISDHLYQNKI